MIGIYKITNMINNKCYIGCSKNIEQRWKQHKRIPKIKTSLYNAFRKYGINNFKFEIVELCLESELSEKEKYWINYYNSYNNGYNETLGGEGVHGYKDISIEQYSLSGQYINSYSSIAEAIRITGIKNISNVVNKKNFTAGGFQWFKKGMANPKNYYKQSKNNQKPVEQYTKNGVYIQTFPSIRSATEFVNGKYQNNITIACKDFSKTAYGYKWKFAKNK